MNNKTTVSKDEIERRKRSLKTLRKVMIGIDVFALIVLIMQIKVGDIAYYSYILLIFCNIITFLAKPSSK